MIKGYSFDSPNSVRNLEFRGKQDFKPNFNSIILKKGANPNKLDIISEASFSGGGIITKEKQNGNKICKQ